MPAKYMPTGEDTSALEYGEGRWTIWTASAWSKGLHADRYVLVVTDGKETSPPFRASLGRLRGVAVTMAPLAIEIKSTPSDNLDDLLQLQNMKNWRDLPLAPGTH